MKHKFFEQKKKESLFKDKELQMFAEHGLLSFDNNFINENEQRFTNRNHKVDHRSPPHQKVRYVGGGFAVK